MRAWTWTVNTSELIIRRSSSKLLHAVHACQSGCRACLHLAETLLRPGTFKRAGIHFNTDSLHPGVTSSNGAILTCNMHY